MIFRKRSNDKPGRPSLFWLATEALRAVTETAVSYPYRYLTDCDTGDGHTVLVLPGFMASDASTTHLRNYLNEIGYNAYGWEQGRNYANPEMINVLGEITERLAAESGSKISLIGWSLGGVYARQIAKARPELVRQVITLASPFRGISEPNNVAWIYNLITGGQRVRDVEDSLLADLPLPAPVPTTCIYSKQDGVVPWQYCMEAEEDSLHQNIEVRSSHLGMANNPSVLKIITNRLQYETETWEHFYPGNVVEDLLLYPSFR